MRCCFLKQQWLLCGPVFRNIEQTGLPCFLSKPRPGRAACQRYRQTHGRHDQAAKHQCPGRQRAEDRKGDADRLERIETDIRAMRDLMFEAFQRGRSD